MMNQKGFTLIEIAVSMVLVAVSIIGLNAAFSAVSTTTRDLILRQKAIIAVNNEMERLYGIYDKAVSASLLTLIAGLDCPDTDDPEKPYAATINGWQVEDDGTITPATVSDINGVFVTATENVVPIDFEQRITGMLTLCSADKGDYYDILLILEYPYRFEGAGDPVNADDPSLFNTSDVRIRTSLAK